MTRASLGIVLALAVLAGCPSYASVSRVNAPGIVDISTPLAPEAGRDDDHELPTTNPGSASTVVWLHPSLGVGVSRTRDTIGELAFDVGIERADTPDTDGIARNAWGVMAGTGIFQLKLAEGVGRDVVFPGPLYAEAFRRKFLVSAGAGVVVYPDTRDIGVQTTLRGPLMQVRLRYVTGTGFEALFGVDLHIPLIFGRSR